MPPIIVVNGEARPLYIRSAIGARIDRWRNNNHLAPWKSGRSRKEGAEGDLRRKRADAKKVPGGSRAGGEVARGGEDGPRPEARRGGLETLAADRDSRQKRNLEDGDVEENQTTKRQRCGRESVSNKENGTTARRANAQIRQNKAKGPPNASKDRPRRIEKRVNTTAPSSRPSNNSHTSVGSSFVGNDVPQDPHLPIVGESQQTYPSFDSNLATPVPLGYGSDQTAIFGDSASASNPSDAYTGYQGSDSGLGPGLQSFQHGNDARYLSSTTYLTTPGLTPDVHGQDMSRDPSGLASESSAHVPYGIGCSEQQTFDTRFDAQQSKVFDFQDGVDCQPFLEYFDPDFGECQHQSHQNFGPLPHYDAFPITESNVDHHHLPQEEYDFRSWVPLDDGEKYVIHTGALAPTVLDFLEKHDDSIPPRSYELSYWENFVLMKAEHERLCQAEGKPVTPLVGLGPWYGSLENWESAVIWDW